MQNDIPAHIREELTRLYFTIRWNERMQQEALAGNRVGDYVVHAPIRVEYTDDGKRRWTTGRLRFGLPNPEAARRYKANQVRAYNRYVKLLTQIKEN